MAPFECDRHHPSYSILWGVCWYVAYPISYRQIEEMMTDCNQLKIFDRTVYQWPPLTGLLSAKR
jgi:transposase-like protein